MTVPESPPRVWKVRVRSAGDGSVCIEAADGHMYRSTGMWVRNWPPSYYTKSEPRARRLVAKLEKWCERENAKRERAAAASAALMEQMSKPEAAS